MVQKPSWRSCAEHSWFWCLVSSQYLISMKWITCWSMLRPLVWCLWLVLAVLLRCSQSYPLIGPCHSKCQLGKTEEYDKLIMTKTKRVQTAKSSTFHHSNGTMHLHKARWQKKKEKNYAGSENHSPHYLRKMSDFGCYCWESREHVYTHRYLQLHPRLNVNDPKCVCACTCWPITHTYIPIHLHMGDSA